MKDPEPWSLFDDALNRHYLADERAVIENLLPLARNDARTSTAIETTAAALVNSVRARQDDIGGLNAFLTHYDLSSDEGTVLMCLAEALLRIPDSATVDALIADRLAAGDWQRHLRASESLFVNASTWALMLTGNVLRNEQSREPLDVLGRVLARLEEPVLRASLKAAMRIMASEFVMGQSISEALARTATEEFRGDRFSFDMLGEAALTAADADAYAEAYLDAIKAIGAAAATTRTSAADSGISVKLSALCPRFEALHEARAVAEVSNRLLTLAVAARAVEIDLTIDAEEADRLLLTLRVFESVYRDRALSGWSGLGIAVQAYQKRAFDVLDRLNELAGSEARTIPVRLVKGAYWDTEIKRAQALGLPHYPVFTVKHNTDVSYLACATHLLSACPSLYPRFATHNAHTVSYVYHHAGSRPFEFQRLHGMGTALYADVRATLGCACRVYAPVGAHEDLLPYLVRRLLENGANASFVNQIAHGETSVAELVADPVVAVDVNDRDDSVPDIPLPADIYGTARKFARGFAFDDPAVRVPFLDAIVQQRKGDHPVAAPRIAGARGDGLRRRIFNPARLDELVGEVVDGDEAAAARAVEAVVAGGETWCRTGVEERAAILERAAERLESELPELAALCVLEAGKTLPDSIDDVREAIDFLRYYATEARRNFAVPVELPGPTGESNQLGWRARGAFVCISPWNFPAAIYTGQIAAALAAGNGVIAKPAERSSLTAARVTDLLYEAGVPESVLAFLPGDGTRLGNALLSDPRIAGVAFTGSTDTALRINRTLAARTAPLPVLIAETGGINALIADSSALPEQLVRDVVASAFNSAGQRCSALRLLCLPEEIAPRVLELLTGFMAEWRLGDPACIETDMGPVIDTVARDRLEQSIDAATASGTLLYRGVAPASNGIFVAPAIIELGSVEDIGGEVFGPVLHVVRFPSETLMDVVDDINQLGFGLTLGVHSRIERRAAMIRDRANVGNVYVNRNIIGATVGSQPFGGTRWSGTGPKAGGPNYLCRFAAEQTYTVNTAAVGGNAVLLGTEPSL